MSPQGQYIDGPFGQVHVTRWGAKGDKAPIVCLSPAPFSGAAFTTLAPLLATERVVYAVDYPGYGNSASCGKSPTVSDYARAVNAVTSALGQGAHLLGFHSGCLVATEAALQNPSAVLSLMLVDVPFFTVEKQHELLGIMGAPVALSTELDSLNKAWEFCIKKFEDVIPLPRAYDMFIDYVRMGPNANLAFAAAFRYPCAESFQKLTTPCTVIATAAGLETETHNAAKVIPSATLISLSEIKKSVLEAGAGTLSETLKQNLHDS